MGGGGGEEVTLKLVAKHADVWNADVFNGDMATLQHKTDVIHDHCETVGRDYDEIDISWDGHVICTRDDKKLDRLLVLVTPIQFEEEYTDQSDMETKADAREYFVMSTPEKCAAVVEDRVEAGVDKFCVGLNCHDHAEWQNEEVPKWLLLFGKTPTAVTNSDSPIIPQTVSTM